MKTIARITSILICLILLTSCAQSIDGNLEKDYIKREKSITYYKGAPYSGEMFFNYVNGQLRLKVNYKDGKKDGLYEWYYENGQLKQKTNYKDDKRDGLYEEYYENGQLKLKQNYKDGELIIN